MDVHFFASFVFPHRCFYYYYLLLIGWLHTRRHTHPSPPFYYYTFLRTKLHLVTIFWSFDFLQVDERIRAQCLEKLCTTLFSSSICLREEMKAVILSGSSSSSSSNPYCLQFIHFTLSDNFTELIFSWVYRL